MHKAAYASPSSRRRTQLNETHGNQLTGSILCHFLLARISRVLHCQGSNTFLFLLSSCCSRKQVFSTFFYLSCLLLYTSHVFTMVHLPVQQNSVPFFGIPLLLPNLLKNFPTHGGPTHSAPLFMTSTRLPESRTKVLFLFPVSVRSNLKKNVQRLECGKIAEESS